MHFIGKENYMYKHREREEEREIAIEQVKLTTKIEGGRGGEGGEEREVGGGRGKKKRCDDFYFTLSNLRYHINLTYNL